MSAVRRPLVLVLLVVNWKMAIGSMVLLPLVRSKVDVPIIAAGGFVDGKSMAAAFALGAEQRRASLALPASY